MAIKLQKKRVSTFIINIRDVFFASDFATNKITIKKGEVTFLWCFVTNWNMAYLLSIKVIYSHNIKRVIVPPWDKQLQRHLNFNFLIDTYNLIYFQICLTVLTYVFVRTGSRTDGHNTFEYQFSLFVWRTIYVHFLECSPLWVGIFIIVELPCFLFDVDKRILIGKTLNRVCYEIKSLISCLYWNIVLVLTFKENTISNVLLLTQ